LPTYAYCRCCVDDAVVWCLLTPSLTQTLPALLNLVLICSSMERRESRAYASRAERAWVSSGVNKHRTRPRHLHAPCSPASITPASPVPNAIWAAFHPVFVGNHVNETTAVGAHSSLSAFKDLRTGQTSISATECPLRIPLILTLGQTTTIPPAVQCHLRHADTHACMPRCTIALRTHVAATQGQPRSTSMAQRRQQAAGKRRTRALSP
jgi:hypothetical protein